MASSIVSFGWFRGSYPGIYQMIPQLSYRTNWLSRRKSLILWQRMRKRRSIRVHQHKFYNYFQGLHILLILTGCLFDWYAKI